MNKKQCAALLIMLLIGLMLGAIGIYGEFLNIQDEKLNIVTNAIDAAKECIDITKEFYYSGDYPMDNQKELVELINNSCTVYEEKYQYYKELVGDIPRDETLPRVSVTPIPTFTE